MNNFIKDLYTLNERAIITPRKLLENLKLDNYVSINYKKEFEYLKCTMITQEISVEYNYYFDDRDFLVLAEVISPSGKTILFDRENEIEKLTSKIKMESSIKKVI